MTPAFRGEEVIRLKNVAGLRHPDGTPFFHTLGDKRPSYVRVWKWWKYGIGGVRLETRREGKYRITSREAVLRFLAHMNGEGE